MYHGKRYEVEDRFATGVFYSIFLNAEDYDGVVLEDYEAAITDVEANCYDDREQAVQAIVEEFFETGRLENYLDAVPDAAWIEVIIEENNLVDGEDQSGTDAWYQPILRLDREAGYILCEEQ